MVDEQKYNNLLKICEDQKKLLDQKTYVTMKPIEHIAIGKWVYDNWGFAPELKWLIYRAQMKYLSELNKTVDKDTTIRISSKLQCLDELSKSFDQHSLEFEEILNKGNGKNES